MSDKETQKIVELELKVDKVEDKVEQIYTAISGDEKLGVPGVVKMLQAHIDQSKTNNEQMIKAFKEFKRDIGFEYANAFNAVDLSINHNKQDMEYVIGRVKVLEESDKRTGNKLGFAAVVGGAIGTAVGFLISAFK